MTHVDARTPPDHSWEDALLDLVELVERRLEQDEDGRDEVRALRRAVSGRPRPQDSGLLAGRFQGSRLCLVRAPQAWTAAVQREVGTTAGLVVDVRGEDLLLLVQGLPRQATAGPQDRLARTLTRVLGVAPTAKVGVSTVLESAADAVRGLDEATRALAECPSGQAVLAEDAWVAIALGRMRESLRDSLAVGGPLARLDDPLRSGADLRGTLTAWLEAGGDTRAAAERLHLHPNTLRYRLRRAQELTGLDLDDPLQRLVTHVALTT